MATTPTSDPKRSGWTEMQTARLVELSKEKIGYPFIYVDRKDGTSMVRAIRPGDGPLSIGRNPQASLPLVGLGDRISRTHAFLEEILGNIFVSDAGSQNGTWLNGTRILDGRARLKDRDVITCGEVKIRVRIPEVGPEGLTRQADEEPDWRLLSPQQRRVVLTLVDHWPEDQRLGKEPENAELADTIGMSRRTYGGHLTDIYSRLARYGVGNNKRSLMEVAVRFEDELRATVEDDS